MFSEYAPRYWAKNLPVMPLRPQSKVPWLTSWQTFCTTMPPEAARADWLKAYPDANLGLPLGPQSGIIALDLDTEDPRVAKVLTQLLPPSPWTRVGKKGSVRVFRYNGERTYRIKDESGATIFEVLSRGTQVVLPPSIHPDTMRPYEANCELVDVLDQLVPLPAQFETLARQALINEGIQLQSRGTAKVTDWVPAGGRDSALTSMAGLQAKGVMRGERSLLEALNEIEVWVGTFTERVVGDAMDPAKARSKVMEFIRRDIVEHRKSLPAGWDAGMTPEEALEARQAFGDDVEEWSTTQILDHLQQKFTEIPKENVPGRIAIVDEILLRVSKSPSLTDLDQDLIINFIQSASSRMMTSGSLRKRLKELQGIDIQGNDHTEIAQHLIKEMERYGQIAFSNGSFYQWRGSHWVQMFESEVFKVLAEEFGWLPAARRHADHKGILKTAENLVPRSLKQVDVPGVNFANGYLTLDMELKPHDPAYGAAYCLPYRYITEGPAPSRLLGLLDQCWGDDDDYADKVQAFRQIIASMLFNKGPYFTRAICFFGPPKSGKSTLLDLIMGLIPDESRCSVPPHDWNDTFMPAQMAGKLVNRCGELSETQMIAGDKFKSIVEGAEISAQHKGMQIFTFRPMCMHFFASNHLPRTRDTSAGFTRRWLFLHFTNQVSDDQTIRHLAEQILAEEREAIVAWAIPAIQDLMRQQEYTLPKSHRYLSSEVASQNNSVRFFLTSGQVRVHASPDQNGLNRTSEMELYSLYYAFCKLNANVPPVSLKRFRVMMQELQSELGFQLLIVQEDTGETASYANITVVKKQASSR